MANTWITRFALLAATLGAIGCLWSAWCVFPIPPWNDIRLAPAFALRLGLNPYPALGGGPLSTWIYGPVGLFVNLPATFASTAAMAIQTACLINALLVLAPLAIIFFGSAELRGRGLAACALALVVATLLVPHRNFTIQVADHSAIAFGLLSCWLLARTQQPGGLNLAAAAALCALAIWSKQIAIALLPAQVAFLLIAGERAAAIRYAGLVFVFGLVALALFAQLFGFENLWLNLVVIPGRLPWAEFLPRLELRMGLFVGQLLIPALGLLLAWQRKLWPTRDQESGRFFQICVLAGAMMLPIGLTAFFKIGGDTNALHSWNYLLPAVLVAWLARDRASTVAPALRVLAVAGFALALNTRLLTSLPSRPLSEHFESARQLSAAYPHALWFPQNPVVGYYADGKLWHSEDGLLTRNLAGYNISVSNFRRFLPPDLKGVVYPVSVSSSVTMSLLPEYAQIVRVPYWTLHTRTPSPVVSP